MANGSACNVPCSWSNSVEAARESANAIDSSQATSIERRSSKGACSGVAADEKNSRAVCACAAQRNVGFTNAWSCLDPRSREPFLVVVGRYQEERSKG